MKKIWDYQKFQIDNLFYYYIGKYFCDLYKLKPKVFGIGLNRTGSSSLGRYFEMLGYKHSFETYSAEKIELFINDDAKLKNEMDKFEMHEDWPTAKVYKKLNEMYFDAKFILTLRDTPEQWFSSLMNTSKQEQCEFNHVKKLMYGYGIIEEHHKSALIDVYDSHVLDVTQYFENDKGKLLILKTSDMAKEDKICQFLNIKNPGHVYPHSQKRNYVL